MIVPGLGAIIIHILSVYVSHTKPLWWLQNSSKCRLSQRRSQSSSGSGTGENTDETAQTSDSKMTGGTGTCEQREPGKTTTIQTAGTHPAPKAVLDKSISSEERSASETETNSPDKHPQTSESSSSSDRSERSSNPHTPHTSRPNTPETHMLKDGTTEYKDTSEEDWDVCTFHKDMFWLWAVEGL